MIFFFLKIKRGFIILYELVYIYIGFNFIILEMLLYLRYDIFSILLNF